MLVLFTITIFLSAFLVFLVQPMAARLVLPLLGGSPAVWNTAMVFFQAVLLAGYAYAHVINKLPRPRTRVALHVAVLLLPLVVLPIRLRQGWDPPTAGTPVLWLLGVLVVMAGLPFFVVSTSGPLLQRWFSTTNHPAAKDPYFLYAASNAGSLLALLAYPFAIEPALTLRGQGWLWTGLYTALIVLAATCGIVVLRRKAPALSAGAAVPRKAARAPRTPTALSADTAPVTRRQRLRWIFFAFVPSSLTLGATQYISTDIAAVPLLWVLPLSIYLLTFILAFSRRNAVGPRLAGWATPVLFVAIAALSAADVRQPLGLILGVHLGALFFGAMLCHGRLAAERPAAAHLTEFYIWLAVGGVLGGLFNAIVAPLAFDHVYEYPFALALACLARPASPPNAERKELVRLPPAIAWGLDVLLPVFVVALYIGQQWYVKWLHDNDPPAFAIVRDPTIYAVYTGGLPALVCLLTIRRPLRVALAAAGLFGAGMLWLGFETRAVYTTRTFFGSYSIVREERPRPRVAFMHGTTNHGVQSLEPGRSMEPMAYYHRAGPLGGLFAAYGADAEKQPVAVVGLGSGGMAAYGREGQQWDFYEIDPAVAAIASEPVVKDPAAPGGRTLAFTYMRDTPASHRIIVGDGRLRLARHAPEGGYGLIALDAFSSDAVPVHLLTADAVRMYVSKLRPHGLLVFNISNRYVHLAPVLGRVAEATGLVAYVRDDRVITAEDMALGRAATTWVVMARRTEDLASLVKDPRWRLIKPDPRVRVWTDDYSNILRALRPG
jgi:hypothetical protein